jgi:hypothetical protein
MSRTGHAETASPLHAALRRSGGDLLVYRSECSLLVSNQNSPRLHSHNNAIPRRTHLKSERIAKLTAAINPIEAAPPIVMAKRPIDRRVARTRAMLQKAHISLILEKGYEAITVEDICEVANVGRSTFYAHYTSKDDLRRSGLENLRRLLVDRQKDALAMPGDQAPELGLQPGHVRT